MQYLQADFAVAGGFFDRSGDQLMLRHMPGFKQCGLVTALE
jgi:hypothetical protein